MNLVFGLHISLFYPYIARSLYVLRQYDSKTYLLLPMLFISSTTIAQHAYSHACASSSPTGAPVEPSREVNDSINYHFALVGFNVQGSVNSIMVTPRIPPVL